MIGFPVARTELKEGLQKLQALSSFLPMFTMERLEKLFRFGPCCIVGSCTDIGQQYIDYFAGGESDRIPDTV